ncbi:MAG: hydrogenase 4 subunit B [Leptospirillum sp.]
MIFSFTPLDLSLSAIVYWFVLAILSLLLSRIPRVPLHQMFLPGAAGSLLLAISGFSGLNGSSQTKIIPLGLPGLPFHLHQDALSSLFLLLIGFVSFGISVFAAGYFKEDHHRSDLGFLSFQYNLFLISMTLVLLSADSYLFLLSWESMAMTSYFLVVTDHGKDVVRQAGFLYLLLAHIGTLALFLSFGILSSGGGLSDFSGYAFDSMAKGHHSSFAMAMAFFLAFFGFGAKAGIFPLHIWLPEAHPVAPSPISALLSGVMLKIAIYGMIRVWFNLIGVQYLSWKWGAVVLAVGLFTALFGILFALTQNDLKRLLAYSSIDNIGIIVMGLGLSIIFFGTGHPIPGALGLIAALYHSLNHAVFKGILFLGAGSILHSSGEKNLNRMGGLIRSMPQTAALYLVAILSISAIPPLNGFVSEWLTFQTALSVPLLDTGGIRSLVALSAAGLALVSALTAMCFVKVYGIGFLGVPRTQPLPERHEATVFERLGMFWLAAGCLALGCLPTFVVRHLETISVSLTGEGLGKDANNAGWLWLVPESARRASYSPFVFLVVIVGATLLTFFAIRFLFNKKTRKTSSWNCGYPVRTSRMQDTADSFSQPIRHFFSPAYRMTRHLPLPTDEKPIFFVEIDDQSWFLFYRPIQKLVEKLSALFGKLQTGKISVYLTYSFLTLLFLLFLVKSP